MINERVKNKYIRATSDEHGARIIQFLVENGGRNKSGWAGESHLIYFIDKNGVVDFFYNKHEILEGYTEMHLPEELKRGDMVEVSSDGDTWRERIFITEIEGANYPFLCVSDITEGDFHSGKTFSISIWKHCRKVETITREEAEKQLGKKIVG